MSATVPILRPANITAAPGLTPAALSKYTRKLFLRPEQPGRRKVQDDADHKAQRQNDQKPGANFISENLHALASP